MPKEINIKPRVFLDSHNQPKMIKRYSNGEIWVHYLHPNNNWVTQQKLSEDTAYFVADNLTEEEQALYPAIH